MNNDENTFLPSGDAAAESSTFGSHLSHDDDVFQRPAPRPPTQMNHRPSGGDSKKYDVAPFSINNNNNGQPPSATDVSEEHNAAPHHPHDNTNTSNDTKQDDEDKVRLKQVNKKMERILGDIKNNVKAVFKELVSMQQEFNTVKKDLLVIQEEEHNEAANLDTLEVDVGETVAHVSPWFGAMPKEVTGESTGADSYDASGPSNSND